MRLTSVVLLLALCGVAAPQKTVPQKAAPQKAYADVQADMLQARQALQTAKEKIYPAGNEWGGHRMEAIKHIDAALAEVDKAEAYAKAHHYIK
jgi:hypothetical protein